MSARRAAAADRAVWAGRAGLDPLSGQVYRSRRSE